jgi:predicted transcriptional regulator
MSKTPAVTTQSSPRQMEASFPVRIDQAVAQEIDAIATKRQIKVETLINEILEQYVADHVADHVAIKKQSGAAFLLSLAGMFNSGERDTSENVHAIVADFILEKHKEKPS